MILQLLLSQEVLVVEIVLTRNSGGAFSVAITVGLVEVEPKAVKINLGMKVFESLLV